MLHIHFHAAARELAGIREAQLNVAGPIGTDALCELLAVRHPALAPYLSRMRFARNGDFAARDQVFQDGDRVDVLPPVAGGAPAGNVMLAGLREAPLSVDEVFAAITHPSAGGVALFTGVVRDHAEGKPVARLSYEAYRELALREMRRVLEGVVAEAPEARVACVHRVGDLAVGDLAVVAGASAAHRDEAFLACRLVIDRIKETVPIWKKEWSPSGAAHWVNLDKG